TTPRPSRPTLFPYTTLFRSQPIGGRGKSFQGESFFTAENPPFGATFTYYLKEELKTKKAKRQEAERDAQKKNAAINLPSRSELRSEEHTSELQSRFDLVCRL